MNQGKLKRVLRGGRWIAYASVPGSRYAIIGFRLARSKHV